jgi:cytochrome c556
MITPKLLAVLTAVTAITAPAVAQSLAPIEARQALMKQNGKDTKAGAAMLKGEVPFDAARATAIFKSMNDVSMKFGNHFPPDSKTGGDTEASPAIWTKPGEFKAALAKFQKDTATAVAAKPTNLDAFKEQFGAVTANCKSCHEAFRVKAN